MISTVRRNVGRPRRRRFVLGLALGLAMLAIGGAAEAAPLLRPASQTTLSVEKRQQLAADPYVMRWREARLAIDAVFEPSAWDEPLALNLFPDAELEARVRSAKTLESGSQFLSGRLVGGGRFTLFRSAGGILRGEFQSAAGVFTMRSLGPRRVLVKQQDISKLPRCDHDAAMREAVPVGPSRHRRRVPRPQPRSRPPQRQHRPDETVDVLVVYTPNAERSEGGREEIEASIEAEIEKTNQAFFNSGLSHRRVTLASMEKVEYTESTEYIGDDFVRLYARKGYLTDPEGNPVDPEGYLDEVYDLRREYAADIIHLIVTRPLVNCGLALSYSLYEERDLERLCADNSDVGACKQQRRRDSFRSLAFSISAIQVCPTIYTFTHELGHNFGLFHDRYPESDYLSITDPVYFPYTPYGFGYVNQNFSRSECRRTVMAYWDQSADEGYSSSGRELMFSNPDLQLGSEEVGLIRRVWQGKDGTLTSMAL